VTFAHLDPEHLADLRRSGLKDDAIEAAGIRSLPPAEWEHCLGPWIAGSILGAYLIPYPGADGFYRAKLFPPVPDGDGHAVRYYQPPGSAPRLYIPPRARAVLADTGFPLRWTEGEKKALRVDQEGHPCIGLGGLWNWSQDGAAIPELDRIDHVERTEILTPDSDVWTRPELLQAVYALGKELEARGAKVLVEKIPAGPDGTKIGFDDYLCNHSIADLEALPKHPLKHPAFTKTAAWWKDRQTRKVAATLHSETGAADNGRRIILVSPEPWPEPVNGAELLDELVATYRRHIALPSHGAEAAALWTLHTYVHDAAPASPILVANSPVKRCGKTTFAELATALVNRPLPTSNISPAALFRTVEKFSPTLILDEADTFLTKAGDRDSVGGELRGILNAGHTRATAFVIRTQGDEHEPRTFSTWCPKMVALIGRLPATLEDRAIVIPMRRRTRGEPIQKLRRDRLAMYDCLGRQVARWAADHQDVLRGADPTVPGELNDRAADNWRTLLAIADQAGGPWPERARRAARALSGGGPEEDVASIMLLTDLQDLFAQKDTDHLLTESILPALHDMEERPWAAWSRGKPMSARHVAELLRPFEVRSRKVREGDRTRWGYRLADLSDAFTRYLPTLHPEHPEQTSQGLRP
jgi:putative DNA primase/helicase